MSFWKSVKLISEAGISFGLKHINNVLRVINTPYGWAISFGDIADHIPTHIVGHCPITSLTLDDISELGISQIPIPGSFGAAISLEVVSTSINDISITGTGTRTVEIHGLDTNGNEQEEIIAMNGLTPVASANQYSRINSFYTKTNGSYGATSAGDITLQSVGGVTIYRKISLGSNKDLTCFFTIPNGKKGLILDWKSSSTGKETQALLQATKDEEGVLQEGVFIFQEPLLHKDGGQSGDLKLPILVPAKCDIKIGVKALDTAGGTADSSFELFYEPI